MKPMKQTLTALALSATVALGALAPTQAVADTDSDRLAKVIFGTIAVIALADALDNDRDAPRKVYVYRDGQGSRSHDKHIYSAPQPPRHAPPKYVQPKQVKKQPKKIIPDACVRRQDTRDGAVHTVTQGCMTREAKVGRLPSSCEIAGRGGRDQYSVLCLRNKGYRLQ